MCGAVMGDTAHWLYEFRLCVAGVAQDLSTLALLGWLCPTWTAAGRSVGDETELLELPEPR
jgi:hypothetical protein